MTLITLLTLLFILMTTFPYAEMPVKVSGFKQPIQGANWTITTLTHTVNPDSGFTTNIELEVKNDDLPIFLVSSMTKERYNKCQNINCSHTFVTHETFVRSISTPKEAQPVQPHPTNSGQTALSL